MEREYSIIITGDAGDYIVYIPDFQINTQGVSIADACEMAIDAIGLAGVCYEDDLGREIPIPTSIDELQKSKKSDEIITTVKIDFDEYRKNLSEEHI